MRRLIPSLLAVLLGAFALLAVGSAGPASAAQCVQPSGSVPDAVDMADAVVTAKVTKRVAPSGQGGHVHYLAQVTASFKGSASGSVPVVPEATSCNLSTLTVGTTYMLFLHKRQHDWFAPANLPSSSNVAMLQPQVEAAVAPPVVTFSAPLAGEPAPLRRVAAPGVALVIIGLLGLLFVRRSPRSQA